MVLRKSIRLRIVRNKRRIMLWCLLVVSATLLVCPYEDVIEGLHLMSRRAAVREVMNAVGRKLRRQYQVRGPLTIAQVERELFGRPLDPNRVAGASGNPDFDKAWQKIRDDYERGDELYFVESDMSSWRRLNGRRGYVLIRQNRIVDGLTTFLN
jgi:hypothetical protein